ncbi:MAG: hypothetical protein AB9844_08495 [Clostridiaceae bacterium]
MDKTNNLQVFISTIKRYIIMVAVITVAGAAAVGYREMTKAPQYSTATEISLNSDILYEISGSTDELIGLDSVFENIGQDKELQESYKKYASPTGIDAKGLGTWAQSSIEVEQSTKNYNLITVTAVTGSKDLTKALGEAYYRGLDKAIEDVSKEAYSKKIDFYEKKIEVIKQMTDAGQLNGSSTGIYNESIDDLADAKLKYDSYFSPLTVVETTDSVITTGKKALLNYTFVAAVASFLVAVFLVFLIDYARSFKK